jgi:hypothetical protein
MSYVMVLLLPSDCNMCYTVASNISSPSSAIAVDSCQDEDVARPHRLLLSRGAAPAPTPAVTGAGRPCHGRPRCRGDVVEELGVQMHQRERLQLRGEESGEAVGTVGLEGVIVVRVEGGHNGGSTASSITQFTSELRAGWE